MTAYQLAQLLADLVDDHAEDQVNAATPNETPPLQTHRMTPSIVNSRGFLGVTEGEKAFLVTIEEV